MSTNLHDFMHVDLDSSMNYSIGSAASTDSITIDSGSYDWNISNPAMTTTRFDCDVKINQSNDLRIGDRSLKQFMETVEERLNILQPNPKLEGQWNELAALGKQYRALETEILEKEKMWKILKDE